MNIDTSDSSDDEKHTGGGKVSKLKIADVVICHCFFSKSNEKIFCSIVGGGK
jgi:hypothetical protein